VPVLSRRWNAQQLGNFNTAAFRTVCNIAGATDQRFKNVIARLALILIKWHKRNDSSITEAKGHCGQGRESPPGGTRSGHWGILDSKPGVVNAGRIESTCEKFAV
jgi:hypothetical protein